MRVARATPDCMNIHGQSVSRSPSSAADGVFRIAVALAPPSAGACRTGSVILTAKLIAGHDAEGERREPGQADRSPLGASIWQPWTRVEPTPHSNQSGT